MADDRTRQEMRETRQYVLRERAALYLRRVERRQRTKRVAQATGLGLATAERILGARTLRTEHLTELAHVYGADFVDFIFAPIVRGAVDMSQDERLARMERGQLEMLRIVRELASPPPYGAAQIVVADDGNFAERKPLDAVFRSPRFVEHIRHFSGSRFDAEDAVGWAGRQAHGMASVVLNQDGWRYGFIGSAVRLYTREQKQLLIGSEIARTVRTPRLWGHLYDIVPEDGTPIAHELKLRGAGGELLSTWRVASRCKSRSADVIIVTCEAGPLGRPAG